MLVQKKEIVDRILKTRNNAKIYSLITYENNFKT